MRRAPLSLAKMTYDPASGTVINITAKWSKASHDWKAAMNQFAILYQDRFTRPQT